jgi:hypothetical protein
MSCTCQKCGHKYKVDVNIPDYLWELIKPPYKPIGGGLMCGKCIIKAIEKLGYNSLELIEKV